MAVGVFFGEGYEEIEALTVVDLLRRAGISVQMISITGSEKSLTTLLQLVITCILIRVKCSGQSI